MIKKKQVIKSTRREWGMSPYQPVYRRRLYCSCWYKLSLANVDCLSLIMRTPWWLSCCVNTEKNSNRKERKTEAGRTKPLFCVTSDTWSVRLAPKIFSCWLKKHFNAVVICTITYYGFSLWLTSHKTVGCFPQILFDQLVVSTWLKHVWTE